MGTKHRRAGNAVLEFTLVAIPLIFVFISVFEMARGMWMYHTLAYAVKEGTRFAMVHGSNCESPNACQKTVGDIAKVVRAAAVGLDTSLLDVSLTALTPPPNSTVIGAAANPTTCNPLSTCISDPTVWPQAPANIAGAIDIQIRATYHFDSALALFWPGAGGGFIFGRLDMPAVARERIRF